jgi:hypothetical protein
MVESMAWKVLKEGMKTWIVMTERLQAGLAQLREAVDDVVAEARQEYEHRAEGAIDHRSESVPHADANATKPKVSRSRSSRAGTPRGTKTTKVAV